MVIITKPDVLTAEKKSHTKKKKLDECSGRYALRGALKGEKWLGSSEKKAQEC